MLALFIFAHPDDESFTCGGTILKKTNTGDQVKLICATKGEAGELGDPPVCTRDKLPEVREKELSDASKILGISDIYFLDYFDSKLNEAPIDEVSERLLELLKKESPDEVYTFGPNGLTNHADHIAISLAAVKAFGKYKMLISKPRSLFFVVSAASDIEKLKNSNGGYKAFGEISGTPDHEISMKVDIHEELDKKIEALSCHKSQHKDVERFLESGKIINLNFEYIQKVN